jgi:hypothetical protein
MRGSAGAPASTASLSAQRPAQKIAAVAMVEPREWEILIRPPAVFDPRTRQPTWTEPPAAATSAAKAPAIETKSTTAVAGL